MRFCLICGAVSCGILILTCGISVLLDYAVCGLKNVWVTVIGDREVSAVLRFHWDTLVRFFCFCFPKPKCFVFQLAQQLAQ